MDRSLEILGTAADPLVLPIEIFLQILEYLEMNSDALYSIVRSSRRLYDMTIPILYRHPLIPGHFRLNTFISTLESHADLRLLILTIRIRTLKPKAVRHLRHGKKGRDTPFHTHTRFPTLPNCHTLETIGSRDQRSAITEKSIPFTTFLRWAAVDMGSVVTLKVDSYFRVPYEEYEAPQYQSMIDVFGRTRLSTLWLLKFDLPDVSLNTFWSLCSPWMRYLHIKPDELMPHAIDLAPFGFWTATVTPSVRSVTLIRTPFSPPLFQLAVLFPNLEVLTCSLPRHPLTTYGGPFISVRQVIVHLEPTEMGPDQTEFFQDRLGYMCTPIEVGQFPSLQSIELRFSVALKDASAMAELDAIIERAVDVKIRPHCEATNVTLNIRSEIVPHTYHEG